MRPWDLTSTNVAAAIGAWPHEPWSWIRRADVWSSVVLALVSMYSVGKALLSLRQRCGLVQNPWLHFFVFQTTVW